MSAATENVGATIQICWFENKKKECIKTKIPVNYEIMLVDLISAH